MGALGLWVFRTGGGRLLFHFCVWNSSSLGENMDHAQHFLWLLLLRGVTDGGGFSSVSRFEETYVRLGGVCMIMYCHSRVYPI